MDAKCFVCGNVVPPGCAECPVDGAKVENIETEADFSKAEPSVGTISATYLKVSKDVPPPPTPPEENWE